MCAVKGVFLHTVKIGEKRHATANLHAADSPNCDRSIHLFGQSLRCWSQPASHDYLAVRLSLIAAAAATAAACFYVVVYYVQIGRRFEYSTLEIKIFHQLNNRLKYVSKN